MELLSKFKKFTFIISLLLCGPGALAVTNSGITYHGRILNPDNTPVTDSNVQFKMQIRTPDSQSCLMYEEVQSRDLSSSAGTYSITINDGTGSRTDSSAYQLDKIFGNYGTFSFVSTACISGSGTVNWAPNAGDGRAFVVSFKTSTMSSWEPMPTQAINFVPMAIESKQVAGFPGASLFRVENGSGPQTVTSLSPAQANVLLNLAQGTTQYVTSTTNGAALPTFASDPSTPVAGDVWYDSTNKVVKYYDGTSVQVVGSGGAVSGNSITSGTIGGSTSMNTSGSVTAASVSSTTNSTQNLQIYNTGNTHKVTVTVPASLAADYSLQLPGALPTASSQVLVSNAAGVTSWSPAMTIDASNNVGIGTTAPGAKLHVLGSGTAASGFGSGGDFVIQDDGTGASPVQQYMIGGGTGYESINFGPGGTKNAGSVTYSNQNNYLTLSTNTTERLRIDTNGNVGIGTTMPHGLLDVEAADSSTMAFIANTSSTAGRSPQIDIVNFDGTGFGGNPGLVLTNYRGSLASPSPVQTNDVLGAVIGSGASDSAGATKTAAKIQFSAAGAFTNSSSPGIMAFYTTPSGTTTSTERMRIDQSGNVGIGTTTPAGNLAIDNTGHNATLCLNGTCTTTLSGGGGGSQSSASNFTFNSNSDGTGSDGGFNFQSNGSNILQVSNTGAITTYGNITGNSALTVAAGGTNQNLALSSSGTGAVNVGTGNGTGLSVLDPGAASANYVTVKGATTGNAPSIGTAGSDTNINLVLIPKGTGNVGIGTTTPSAALHVGNGGPSTDSPAPSIWLSNTTDSGMGIRNSTTGVESEYWVWGNTVLFGTFSDHDLQFHTHDTARMTITNTGNVGIGTTSPTAGLDIATAGVASTPALKVSGAWYSGGTATTTKPQLLIEGPGATSNNWSTDGTGIGVNAPSGFIGNVIDLQVNGNQVFHIDDSGWGGVPGGFGSGTGFGVYETNPNLYTSTSSTAPFPPNPAYYAQYFAPTDGAVSTMVLMARNSSTNAQNAYIGSLSNTGAGAYSPTIVIGQSTGANAYAERMRIDPSGNVGIGTTTPGSTLDVNGSIHSGGTNAYINVETYNNTAYIVGNPKAPDLLIANDFQLDATQANLGFTVVNTATNSQKAFIDVVATSTGYSPAMTFIQKTGAATYAERMRIDPSGNVGIGTTTPAGNLAIDNAGHNATLCLNGTCSTSLGGGGSQASASNFTFNSNSDGVGSDGGFNFQSNGSNVFQISNTGAITTYGNITGNSALTVAAGGTNQNLTLSGSGSGAVISSSNVGIGTTSALTNLDVAGLSRLQGGAMAATNLTGTITTGATQATVASTTGFPSSGYLWIDNEAIAYTSKTATKFQGMTRAQFGTTAAQHFAGAIFYIPASIISGGGSPVSVTMTNGYTRIGDTGNGASLAVGDNAWAGNNSLAVGNFASANAANSAALGTGANANGQMAMAFGYGTQANAYSETVVGISNKPVGTENPNAWVATDPVFDVGIGNGSNVSAFTILKNGNVGIGTTQPVATVDVVGTVRITDSATLCSSTITGAFRWNNGTSQAEVCDGSGWRKLYTDAGGGPPATPAPVDGYFVVTSGTWTANLGGLQGANAKCLSDLTANSWMGKATATANGLLDANHVRAFMCDEATCQTMQVSTRYFFATSGSPSTGGAYMQSDINGYGPNNQITWSGTNYFGGAYDYLTNNGYYDANGFNAVMWSSTDQNSCYGFQSTMGNNVTIGHSTGSDQMRWLDMNGSCSSVYHLACFVHPQASAAPPPPTPPSFTSGGFLVATSATTNGNIGGLAGGNTFCRSDLSAHTWKNKPGSLNTAKVFALLCDTGGCQMPQANTTFAYAVSGDAASGGATFNSDSLGQGPNDALPWNTGDHFSAATTSIWGPGGPGYVPYNFTNTPATQPTDNCANWTDSSSGQSGVWGNTSASDAGRWSYNSGTCDTPRKILCFVNP